LENLNSSDPDNHQFPNLLEYAMDLNPWVANDKPMEVEFDTNGSVDEGTHNLLTVGADIDPPATGRLFVRILVE
jgi:hypothetical protein